jgi:hypothetical protein
MCPRGDTQYFLEIERIVLDQHLKAALERAAGLRSRAIRQHDVAAADEVTQMERIVLSLRRRLRKLTPQTAQQGATSRSQRRVDI